MHGTAGLEKSKSLNKYSSMLTKLITQKKKLQLKDLYRHLHI
ncbi:hypothetical protein [Clostridium botulinum]|nr:hypothetical protein [Clostridium botulinum]ADF98725.1 hypothetical protein CBF_0958 [Clostridium botulinum F str. 230613]